MYILEDASLRCKLYRTSTPGCTGGTKTFCDDEKTSLLLETRILAAPIVERNLIKICYKTILHYNTQILNINHALYV